MRSEQSGTSRRAVAVNDAFFEGLQAITSDMRETALASIATMVGEPLTKVRAIADGTYDVPDSPEKTNSDADLRQLKTAITEKYLVERVLREVQERTETSFHLNYTNGYSVQTSSLENLKGVLRTEPGCPQWLSIRAGGFGSNPSLVVRLFSSSATYEVSGDRRDVDYIYGRIRDLLEASQPHHAWLHSQWVRAAVNILLSGCLILAGVLIVHRLKVPKDATGVLIFIVGGLAGFAGLAVGSNQMQRAFPTCQFEYGAEWRRLTSRRALLFVLVTALLIPAALALIL